MVLSEFTSEHLKQFKKNKYNLSNDSELVKLIRTERDMVKHFIINNPNLKIKMDKIDDNYNQLNEKINEYSKVSWVDTKSVISELNRLNNNYLYEWESIINNDSKPYMNYIYVKTDETINNTSKKMRLLVYIIEYLKHKNQHVNKQVIIYLVLTNLKKYFPENNENMGVKNANTGYTDSKIIYIWRKEEVDKVIFHEICHFMNMDKREQNVDSIIKIQGPHSYFEALTDFFGVLYHLVFVSIMIEKSVKGLLEIELGFIKNQSMYLNEYLGLGNWKDCPINSIKQTTPAFSYYILKFMIFEYLINNKLIDYDNYNELIFNISKVGFKQNKYIKLKSSRMTLFQLE
jgi:hypothetical protein